MAAYRFYYVNRNDHVFNGQLHECDHDLAALERAQSLCGEHSIEVWQKARRVALVGKHTEIVSWQDAKLAFNDNLKTLAESEREKVLWNISVGLLQLTQALESRLHQLEAKIDKLADTGQNHS